MHSSYVLVRGPMMSGSGKLQPRPRAPEVFAMESIFVPYKLSDQGFSGGSQSMKIETQPKAMKNHEGPVLDVCWKDDRYC